MTLSRRYAQVLSDEEEEEYVPDTTGSKRQNHMETERNRKTVKLYGDEDDVEENETERTGKRSGKKEKEEEKEKEVEKAKPIGESVKVTGKGKGRRTHFRQFEYNGKIYELEDSVLMVPEYKNQKPYVAIIKDITQTKDENIMILGQWFYRPEEAEKKGGGYWQSNDPRDLFYSFHRDEVPAESVMHKCIVHFVPPHKQLPKRRNHPGFIIQKVYDTVEKTLWKLTDKDYQDSKQHEINLLVEKTMLRLGDALTDLEPMETPVDHQENLFKPKRLFRKVNVDVRKEGEDISLVAEAHGILKKFDSLTGDVHRDKCLGKLLEAVQHICYTSENLVWPDAAVGPVCALEKASYESHALDYHRYNQKMRTLVFNLKNNALLARRLLNGELEPVKILNMSPTELKEGLTAEEREKKEPDEAEPMQMTDARCLRCSQIKVGLRDIIQAGHGERYQLECMACGHSWYASRDEVSTLTVDAYKNLTKSS